MRPPMKRNERRIALAAIVVGTLLVSSAAAQDSRPANTDTAPTSAPTTAPAANRPAEAGKAGATAGTRTIEEARLAMSKWIETQQIISKEKKDWQQAREILLGRVELVKQEVLGHEQKIKEAEGEIAEAKKKKDDLIAQNEALKTEAKNLVDRVVKMEVEVKKLMKRLPDPLQTKLQPVFQRIPEDPTATRVSVAERFQNVLQILNEAAKAQNEITVNVEVRTLAGGKVAEVKTIYIGLAQGFYVSPSGEAGIGRPTDDGWKWDPSPAVAKDVLTAVEILEGKHSPAYVPLPVKLQ